MVLVRLGIGAILGIVVGLVLNVLLQLLWVFFGVPNVPALEGLLGITLLLISVVSIPAAFAKRFGETRKTIKHTALGYIGGIVVGMFLWLMLNYYVIEGIASVDQRHLLIPVRPQVGLVLIVTPATIISILAVSHSKLTDGSILLAITAMALGLPLWVAFAIWADFYYSLQFGITLSFDRIALIDLPTRIWVTLGLAYGVLVGIPMVISGLLMARTKHSTAGSDVHV